MEELKNDQVWFEEFKKSPEYALLGQRPLAYFCIEYALSESLPMYAGGLGVLAGDYVRELADRQIPAVAVGLYYQSKYGALDDPQQQIVSLTPQDQGLKPVLDSDEKQLLVKVPVHDRYILVKVWLWHNGSIPIYLLDTNVEGNPEEDRSICFKLYDSNKETRLKQEIVLGIGGFRVLEKLQIEPLIYHINEGHSVMLDLEIIRHEMQKHQIGFRDAIPLASQHLVFTNHTLLGAGNEIYSNDLFTYLLEKYASELEIPVSDLAALGEIPESKSFSMSLFARRLAGKINAVSLLHAEKAQMSWNMPHVEGITNGIHIPTWECVSQADSLNENHQNNKKKLLQYIKEHYNLSWNEDELIIGWARRMVAYKRPLALFGDIQRLKQIINNAKKPVRIVLSGKAHQGDEQGIEFIHTIKQEIENNLSQTAVFITQYNTEISKMMTSGCDLWLNTPVVGSEACGTSGMKACLNGVLPVSTKDGWINEVDLNNIGWILDNDTIQDSILNTLEKNILPMYYSENHELWNVFMKNARELIIKKYSATRMLREYFEKSYLPILSALHK